MEGLNMKTNWFKRILCSVLALVLVLGNVPVTALAEEPLLQEERLESTEETLPAATEETIPEPTAEETVPEPTAEETVPEPTAEAEEETEAAGEPVPEATEENLLQETAETLLGPGQPDTAAEDETDAGCVEIPFQFNPLYEGLIDPADYENWEPEVIAPSTYAVEYLTEEEAAEKIREYMCARVESFSVTFVAGKEYAKADYEALFARAFSHTGNPIEGDYLRWQYAAWKAFPGYSVSGNTYQYTVNFQVPYYTTAEQEEELNAAVERLLNQLNLRGKSDYEKIKGIYDYICQNVTYDDANLRNDYYTLKFTAYAALMNKTAVCQGYAVLLYRLALTLGIDCRFIGGTGNGGPHGWNIVKLGDLYYNADATWDAGYTNYWCFLKGPAFDVYHIRDDEYKTETFHTAYPMASEDYDPTASLPVASGTCGDALTWTLMKDGTLTISGTGDMADYTGVSPDGTQGTPAPWYSDRASITEIVIQEGVTSIGSWAFNNCTNVTNVSLPDSLTAIGEAAFFGCSGLTEVAIPSSITALGNLNFAYCTNLSSISLPDSLQVIGDNAFLGCTQLRTVAIPESVSYIGGGSFQGCTSLASVNIPSSVASIGMYAFFDCTALKAVTIPDTVMFIGDWAFGFYGEAKPHSKVDSFVITTPRASEGYFYAKEHDIALITQGVFVPNFMFVGVATRDLTVNAYSDNAVLGSIPKGDMVWPYVVSYMNMDDDPDQGLVMGMKDTDGTITWGKFSAEELADTSKELVRGLVSLSEVREVLHGECGDSLTWMLMDGVLTISGTGEMDGMVAQYIECVGPWKANKDDIRSVVIEEGVTSIGAMCFTDCTNLESVKIPSTVERIDPFAFFGTGLKQVSIPAGVREIGHAAFSNCSSLERIVAEGNNDDADFREVDGVLYDRYMKYLQVYPAAKPEPTFTVPDSVTHIDDWACVSAQFTQVILPQGLAGIGLEAFAGCANLNAILIPSGVSTIRYGAFQRCGSLTEITFAHSSADRLSIEENAFGLNSSTNVATKILVTNTARIHSAISGYDWAASNRAVSYESLPQAQSIVLMLGENELGDTQVVDMREGSTRMLSAQIQPEGALNEVSWTSSNTRIATVHKQTGQVTLLTPGTVTITAKATDGSGVKDSVKLNVIYLDAARTLTAKVEGVPAIGLQPRQTAAITVSGENPIAPENLIYTTSNASIATVNERGVLTAGTEPDTVTITAALKGDPLKRKATVKVPVIAMQTAELSVAAVAGNGEVLSEPLDKDSAERTYTLTAQGKNYLNEVFKPNVTWVSMDPAVARVTPAGDGTMTLTIPANASGECFVTATSKDLAKVTARLKVTVRDFAPRLGSSSITLNSYSWQGVTLDLRESYGNAIESATLTGAPSGIQLNSDTLTLYAKGVKNGTYKNIRLDVTCANEVKYSYMLQVKVANSLPSVSVKQTEKINLFYNGSTAGLTITAPGQTIDRVELRDTENFAVDYDKNSRTASISYIKPVDKPDTKATLYVWLDGYNTPASKSITISTTTTAPKLRLSSTASTINTVWGEQSVSMQVLDSNGDVLELNDEDITVDARFADTSFENGVLTLTLPKDSKGGTAEISVWDRDSNWVKPVTLKHKVTVSAKLPTLVQGKKSLTLSSYFTEQTDEMSLALSQRNLTLETVALTCTAKESEKLNVYYADGSVHAEVIDTDKAPKPGTYSYTCTWTAPNEKKVSTKVKVVVASTLPKVKLSATTVKLNSYLAGDECVQITPTVGAGYTIAGFKETPDWVDYKTASGKLEVKLKPGAVNGKYPIKLTPILCDEATGQKVNHPTQLSLTVQVYNSEKLSVSLSAKGKLDTLNPDSTIVYTPKLTNCIGEITDVSPASQDAGKFRARLENGKIVLALRDDQYYATNVTYKVQFRVKVCGKEILSPVMKVKVTQSAVKRTVTPGSLTLYQSQSTPLTLRLTQSMGEIHNISISTKTSSELLKALGENGFNANIDGNTAVLKLTVENAALLKAGKSYTLYLDVTPKNNATNLKPAQVRLTVKVMK